MAWYSFLTHPGPTATDIPVTNPDGSTTTIKASNPTSPLDVLSSVKGDLQNVIQGPPPTDPSKTPAGQAATTFENNATNAANNFTPTPAPETGKDPALKTAVDQATSAAQQAQQAYNNLLSNLDPQWATLSPANQAGLATIEANAFKDNPDVQAAKQALDAANKAVTDAQNAYDSSIDPRLLTTPQTIAPAPTVTAPTISTPTLGPAPTTTGVTVDPNSLPQVSGGNYSYNPALIDPNSVPNAVAGSASGAGVTAQNIDPNAGEVAPVADIDISGTVGRQAQLEALGLDRTAAEGSAPSAAQILMQQGIDSAVGSGYGLAASLQGRNPGQALIQGVTTASDTALKGAAQSAALRATEMADARGAFGTLASQIAAGDIQVAQSNQTKNLQIAITDANNKLDALKANQTAQLNAGIATAANATAASIATLQAQTTVSVANMNKSVAIDVANQTASNDASKANAANALAAATTDAVNRVQVIMQNMKDTQDANDQNAANALAVQLEQAREALATAQSNQTALLNASTTNATNQTNVNINNATLAQGTQQFNASKILGVDQGNQQADLTQQQINNAMQLGLSGQAFNAVSLGLQTAAQYAAAQAAYNAGFAQFITGAGKIAASGGTSTAAGSAPPVITGANGAPILD